MRVNIKTYGDLRQALGERFTMDLKDGATLEELASKIRAQRSSTKKRILKSFNLSKSNQMVLVNGRNINTLNKLKTELNHGDTVTIIPLVVGG
ncbi:MAG: MoaD family protein [Candidatus Bathyarchaeota archaeon]|nr:MAG: MoaD family protein [Candidatus Bathyarchaeota archaeon]